LDTSILDDDFPCNRPFITLREQESIGFRVLPKEVSLKSSNDIVVQHIESKEQSLNWK